MADAALPMIASYLHNFIFIKTKKTGGTALEFALARSCGPADIITPLGPRDELLRSASQAVPRNFASDRTVEQELHDALLRKDRDAYGKARRQSEYYAHMTAAELKKKLSPEFWERAYKITIERHPYERAVSAAYFNYKEAKDGPFDSYLETFLPGGTYATFGYYSVDGNCVVDEFLRQETLEADFKRVAGKLQLPVTGELPRIKSRSRKDKRPAAEILSPEQKQIVFELCRREFELMDYAV